jgi:hypothetical protein
LADNNAKAVGFVTTGGEIRLPPFEAASASSYVIMTDHLA